MKDSDLRKIVFAAMLAALTAVVKTLSIHLTGMRISIFPIPLLIAGYFLGPAYGLVVGFVADTGYMLYTGNFWSLYTISTMIWGFSGSLLRLRKYSKNIMWYILVLGITGLLETTINSVAYLISHNWDLITLYSNLGVRLLTQLVRLPILVFATKSFVERIKILDLNISL